MSGFWRVFGVAFFLLFTTAAWGQLAPPAVEPMPKPEAKAGEAEVREQTIYIPYSKLRALFEKQGRGVFLPYEQFQALWKAAREKKEAAPEIRPPVSAMISEAESVAKVEKDVVRVTAKLTIDLITEGWHRVPLRLNDAAVLSAKIGEAPARLIHDANEGYTLLVEKKGKDPQQIVLNLEYARSFTKSPGQNSVSFAAPQAPVNRWRVQVPEAGVKVEIQPMVAAATEPPAMADAKETTLLAFVGSAPSVRIDWTPKSAGAVGMNAAFTVQAEEEIHVDERVVRTRVRLNYEIRLAQLTQLVIDLPADQTILNVVDPNVRQWEKKEGAAMGKQRIAVDLFQPATTTQSVAIELEKLLPVNAAMPQAVMPVAGPVIEAVGARSQQGIVVVSASETRRVEVTKSVGLTQLDFRDLPPTLAGRNWLLAYRYGTPNFDLALAVEPVEPRIRTDELVEAYLLPDELTLDLFAVFEIERAGIFQFEIDIPAGFTVRTVRGQAGEGIEAAAYDGRYQLSADGTKLTVNLNRKALGKVGLFVELHKVLKDENLLTPTGKSANLPLAIPRVAPAKLERSTGRLIVYAPESLRIQPEKPAGLREVAAGEAFPLASQRAGRFPTVRDVLTYAYTSEPATIALVVERRKPHVEVRQSLEVKVEPGVLKYTATFFYDIRYSGVKELRIDVPQALVTEGGLRNLTKAFRDQQVADPTPKPAAGYVAWTFTADTEQIDKAQVQLAWEQKLKELKVNEPAEITLPKLVPQGVDLASGQILVRKTESLDVHESDSEKSAKGVRLIDPQYDLKDGVDGTGVARAFAFQEDDWGLVLTAVRYQMEEVKRTSVEMVLLRVVPTKSGALNYQALLRVRSARPRLKVQLAADPNDTVTFDRKPTVNGVDVDFQKGDTAGELQIPLVGQTGDAPLLIEIRYTLDGGPGRIVPPTFTADETAVQKVYAAVYLPQEWVLVGAEGPWSSEQREPQWRWEDFAWHAEPRITDAQIEQQLLQACSLTGTKPTSIALPDDKFVLFSTVRPEPGPAGALRLTTIDRTVLTGLIVLAFVVLALGLLQAGVAIQAASLALLAAAFLLIGLFAPTFTIHTANGLLLACVLVVVALWIAWFFVAPRTGLLTATPDTTLPPGVIVGDIPPPPPPLVTPAPETPSAGSPAGDAGKGV